jgi:hypothetical protein
VYIRAAPQRPHFIFPASHVFFALCEPPKEVLLISLLRQVSHVSEDTSPSCGAMTRIWSFKFLDGVIDNDHTVLNVLVIQCQKLPGAKLGKTTKEIRKILYILPASGDQFSNVGIREGCIHF